MGRKPMVRSHGATKSASPGGQIAVKGKWLFFLPILIAILSLFFFRIDWNSVYEKAYMSASRPLAKVRIEGKFRFVKREDVKALISSKLDGGFVDLNLQSIKSSVESEPWIESVLIERVWPDNLKLKIVEQTPIARWKDNGFINREGELVVIESNKALIDLPSFSGDQQDSKELARNYLAFSEMLKNTGLQISGLEVDKKSAWTLHLKDGFTLVLGRENIRKRLEDFRYVFEEHLVKNKSKISRIDMRYESGMAVKWEYGHEWVAARSVH